MAETRRVRLKRKASVSGGGSEEPRKGVWLFATLVILAIIAFFVVVRVMVARDQAKLNRTAGLESKGLYFTLEMARSQFAVGEPIDVTMSVRNVTSQPITLKFEVDQEFDFLVQKEMNLLFAQVPMNVWRFSSEEVPKPDPHTITIAPGKVKTFSATWSQKDFKGETVKPGRYIITGYLNALDRKETLQLRGKTD